MGSKKVFKNEQAMQRWLSNALRKTEDFVDLITNEDEIEGFEVNDGIRARIKESYLHCLKSLRTNHVIAENMNISLKKGDVLKPDFLVYSAEAQSILIVELKNETNASREAGTELGAYAGELKSYFPFIADGDLPCVIISSAWPVLLRHYIFHEIFWHHRNVICLEPVILDGEKRLGIFSIDQLAGDNADMRFSERHFGGYHVALYYIDRLALETDMFAEQMRTALIAMASKGNRLKSHGFAFLWTDSLDLPATHAITMATLAPFQTFERLLHSGDFIKNKLTNEIGKLIVEHDPSGHGVSLDAISDRGMEFLSSFCSPQFEGFVTWNALKEPIVREGTRLLAFACWGFVEDLYFHELAKAYAKGEHYRSFSDPDVGLRTVLNLFDPNYNFIEINSLGLFSDHHEEDD
jgi:hypothetical protein